MDEKIEASNANHIGERSDAEKLPEFVAERIDQLDHGSEITLWAAIGLLTCQLVRHECGSRARP